MLVTDLTAGEIVVGKLVARVVPVVGLLLASIPALALGALLGGVDPWVLGGAMVVTLGVAISGCAGALAFSTWGTKIHEVLLATYAAAALWLLAVPMWWGYRGVTGSGFAPPKWFEKTNPIWLVAATYFRPGEVTLEDQVVFCVGSLAASFALIVVAMARLRRVAIRQGGAKRRRASIASSTRLFEWLTNWVPKPSLDANPVLWREWHRRRSSRWARAVWWVYGLMVVGLTGTLIVLNLTGGIVALRFGSIGNGFQAGIGLLLLSVSAATVLAEERARGSLDILLVTPLSTRSIVWGKWWGTFRSVPLLAIGPGVLAAALARGSGRWEGVVVLVSLYLAYGAAVTSLGLALATWIRRLDLAVAASVAVLGGVTVGWIFAVVLIVDGPSTAAIAAGSPIVGVVFPTVGMRVLPQREWGMMLVCWSVWTAIYVMIAAVLGWITVSTFDRCMSRVSDRFDRQGSRAPSPHTRTSGVVTG
jgi:ABC-type transport system involved in multi-copper enzyme maturation permease subunit